MNTSDRTPPTVYLAPLEGHTDCIYRRLFVTHFGNVDKVFAPYVTTKTPASPSSYTLSDLQPENNPLLQPVPQALNNDPDDFLVLARRLSDLGYDEVNWNLGCPFPMAVKKKRGAGLLPYPELVDRFLDRVCAESPVRLSIKTRLGKSSVNELEAIIPVFNRYPVTEITIHPRTADQGYRGVPDLEAFCRYAAQLRLPVVYNDNINATVDYRKVAAACGTVSAWMLGRGALADPFLPARMKGCACPQGLDWAARIRQFHDALLEAYGQRLSGPGHLLNRMKEIWQYLGVHLGPDGRQVRRICKCRSVAAYLQEVDRLFSTLASCHHQGQIGVFPE